MLECFMLCSSAVTVFIYESTFGNHVWFLKMHVTVWDIVWVHEIVIILQVHIKKLVLVFTYASEIENLEFYEEKLYFVWFLHVWDK